MTKANAIIPQHVLDMLKRIRRTFDRHASENRHASEKAADAQPPAVNSLRVVKSASRETVDGLWRTLKVAGVPEDTSNQIADSRSLEQIERYNSNIENFIGTIKVPVGVIGPVKIRGINALGDYLIPLATSEAALVASYGRGALVASKAGGINTAVLYEGVMRTPVFRLSHMINAGLFVEWVTKHIDRLKAAAESTTRHGKLISLEPIIDANLVFLICRYTTGDASGQNMVTLATHALAEAIIAHCPVTIERWYIEGNYSGDKKASYLGMSTGRGRKVSAAVTLPAPLVQRYLGTTVEDMLAYGQVANLGALLSGQFGAQAHYANGLAALYIATGQDVACVSESAVGFTRMEARGEDLFCSVTMPNILVGSVGGGTQLPSQAAALDILGLRGAGKGAALAEVTAALCLCGEISIVAAMAAGDFVQAHRSLARTRIRIRTRTTTRTKTGTGTSTTASASA